MEVKIKNTGDQLVTMVKIDMFGEINIVQGSDDLIFIEENRLREFVAAVRAVASHILGEEV